MSLSRTLVLLALFVLCLPVAAKGKRPGSKQDAARKKLKAITLLDLEFKDEPVGSAFQKLANAGKEQDPDGKGFKFVLPGQPILLSPGPAKPKPVADPTVTANLGGVSFAQAVATLCKAANWEWTLMPGTIICRRHVPKSGKEAFLRKPSKTIRKQLEEIIIPKIAFQDVPVSTVFDFLAKRSRKIDVSGDGVTFHVLKQRTRFIKPDEATPKGSEPTVTLDFNNVPLGTAIRYVCRAAEMRFSVRRNHVLIYP